MKFLGFSIFLFLFLMNDSFSMMRALNTAASGMVAQDAQISSISNNIANSNTTAYKRERAEFEDLQYQTIIEAGARSDSNTMYQVGLQIGAGAKVSGVKNEFAEGSPIITNEPYDLMIQGDGFFGIMMPDGTLSYTRNGAFTVDYQGNLVTGKGYKVFPGIQFPPNSLYIGIADNGTVEVNVKNQKDPLNLGQIAIFTFINQGGLKRIGGNLYRETRASGAPVQMVAGTENAGSINQGTIESSNVSTMTEMTRLIKAQRTFEMNSKVMGVADQMLQTVNNIR